MAVVVTALQSTKLTHPAMSKLSVYQQKLILTHISNLYALTAYGLVAQVGAWLRANVVPFQLPAPQSGTLSWILSGTRSSVETVSGVCLKRICSLDTSAFSALEVTDDNCAL